MNVKQSALVLAGLTLALGACGQQRAPTASLPRAVAAQATCATTNLALNKPALASSSENPGYLGAAQAVDGNGATRWASLPSDPQTLQVNLGSVQQLCSVTLQWEAAYAKTFKIQVSNDGNTWTDASPVISGTGGTQVVPISASGQYVRLDGLTRATGYGYSLFEFQVFGAGGTTGGGTGGGSTSCTTTNAALNKPALASSTENPDYLAAKFAFDGDTTTRWASQASDPQSLQVNLGSRQQICGVTLQWEAAYGKAFEIQGSNDGTSWTKLYGTTTGTGGTQTLPITDTGTYQYVRLYGTARGTGYGYSLFEFQVFTGTGGTAGGGTTPPTTLPTSDTPDFGPNVAIFDPSMPSATIQAKLDSVFEAQKLNQFGDRRDALLFKPGSYSNSANIGYYTSIAGLGLNPTDATINGAVTVDAFDGTGNATQNFWRSTENLTVDLSLSGGRDRWAVAQAAPFRRMFVRGGLDLYPASYGYASGGYIADSVVVGSVASASQQQWYSRDSSFGSWDGSVWNMVFSGVTGAPPQHFPNPSYTVLATTPVAREKPFLYFQNGKYAVFTPALRTNVSGPSWPNTPGASIPMSQFYVARPSDATATLNAALAQGLNLFFTPGVYHLSQTLKVTRANTVVLGIGYPTLIPDGGVDGMSVADVDGVKLAGLLFDAGTTNSGALLTVGTAGSHVNHAANPTTIQDVFFRIGGASAGKATNSLIVNSDNAIIDHIWAWRADHGNVPTGWTINTADTGLIVNGNNVLATGLFVEHYQKYNVLWNGQNGKTIFFQNEMPYDPPNQAAWQHDGVLGYAAYKVADNVTSHEAWGLGSYIYTNVDPTIHSAHAFEVPNVPGVKFHDMVTVSLNNQGTIDHIVNGAGGAVPIPGTNTSPQYLVSFP